MKAVILAGGLGTRISEETILKPKPMIEIGGFPILWHIMKIYSYYGVNEFIICCGYKGYIIKEYFSNYLLHGADVSFDFKSSECKYHDIKADPWKVTLVDTGDETMTGGRIGKIKEYLGDDETFCLTYGDGVADINISDLIKYHKKNKRLATVTATIAPMRFGALSLNKDHSVSKFKEKSKKDDEYVNGGFFVLSKEVLNLIKDQETIWERGPMEKLSKDNQLQAFVHNGFWQPMDTLREKNYLEELWRSGKAPWKVWNE